MKRLRISGAIVALAGIMITACDDPLGPAPTELTDLPRALSAAERDVIAGSNRFAFELLKRVHATEDAPNVFLSPLSASMALGMVMNGAAADTWSQMRDVLGFDGMAEDEINVAYRDLIDLLLGLDPSVTFGLGNSIWSRQGIPFHDSFYDRVTQHFDAEVTELDFDDPGAPDVINAWASDRTNGRIDEMVEKIEPEAIMFLLNAIYFKGDWRDTFDPDDTAPAEFERDDGSTVTVDMMTAEINMGTIHMENGRGVELRYGAGAFSAVALQPFSGVSIHELVASLDADAWAAAMGDPYDPQEDEHTIYLPRFEIEYERSLVEDLEALGMVDAVTEHLADFTRLTPLAETFDVWITEVLQKTFLKVDEKGTEAAAVTSVTVGVDSAPAPFRFDRPFLFAIRERFSGTILFIGVIGDPTA